MLKHRVGQPDNKWWNYQLWQMMEFCNDEETSTMFYMNCVDWSGIYMLPRHNQRIPCEINFPLPPTTPPFWACPRGDLLTTWQYDKIWIDVKLQIVITRVIWTGEDQLQRQVELKDLIHRGTWNPGKNWQQWLSQDSTQPLDFTSWRKASWSEFLGTAKQKKTSEFAKRLPW